MAKRKRAKRWVESGPLGAWMKVYARWLAGQPGAELAGSRDDIRSRYPTADQRAAKASELAGRKVQPQLVALMEKRKDFRDYFERLHADSQFLAKEMAAQRVVRNFEARDMALDRALDAQVDPITGKVTAGDKADVRAVETFTRPYIEHGMPKKENQGPPVQRFTINLIGASPEQKKLLLRGITEPEEPDEIDFEVIENPKLLSDGDDD